MKKHHKIYVHYEMEAYLWTSGKNGIIYSTSCKCFVSYLIYHLPVSLSFLKNVVHFPFILIAKNKK